MRVRLLPSVCGEEAAGPQFLTTFVINDTVAIDAGALGFAPLREQRRVRHVVLSHAHLDHIASLPIFLENVYTPDDDCVTVYGSDATLEVLQHDLFNDRVWPDFLRLSKEIHPFSKLRILKDGETVELEGLKITPIPVNHIVPTHGFLIEEGGTAVVIATDTGPTRAIWNEARRLDGLRAVFLDVAFPDSYGALADASKHLTPSLFAEETKKLDGDVRFLAVHVKAAFRARVLEELEALSLRRMEIAEPGTDYRF